MERQAVFDQYQQVTVTDAARLVAFPTESLDALTKEAITDELRFVGFTVAADGPHDVLVGSGRIYKNGQRFYREADEGGLAIALLSLLPTVTKRVVSIVAYGDEILTDPESRAYKNTQTGETFAQSSSRIRTRYAYVDKVAGQENVDPQPPALDANVIRIANVYLGTGGIERIEAIDANRLVSTRVLDTRLTLVERRLDQTGSQIDTLRTDLGGLADTMATRASWDAYSQLAGQVARLTSNAGLPDGAKDQTFDDFLTDEKSDTAFSGYNALIDAGLRFGAVATARKALIPLNSIDSRITVRDGIVTAASTPVKRISITGKTGEIALASYQIKNIVMKKWRIGRRVWKWVRVPNGRDKFYRGIAIRDLLEDNAQTLKIYERVHPLTAVREALTSAFRIRLRERDGEIFRVRFGCRIFRRRRKWITTDLTVDGYQVTQTFFNAQAGSVAKAGLFFTRKGSTGNVKLVLLEVDENGEGDIEAALAEAEVTPAQINADPAGLTATEFDFGSVPVEKGRRYGLRVITQGSHWLATTTDKFAEGAAFALQNDVQNQLLGDIPFELWFHEHPQTRIEVSLEPLTLAGGMTHVDANFDADVPEGCELVLQGKTTGDWFTIPYDGTGTNPLAASPETVQLRMVMIGTTADMPRFGTGNDASSVTAYREGTALLHVSEERTTESDVDTVRVRLWGAGLDAGDHTLDVAILTGASFTTVEEPDLEADLPVAYGEVGEFAKTYTFTLAAPTDSYKIRITGARTSVAGFVVDDREDVSYNA